MGISLGFSRELSTLAYLMTGDRCSLGKAGEMYAKILLEAHGYLADIDHKRLHGDLKVIAPSGLVMRVEVKTARLSKRKYFEFALTVKNKAGQTCTDCKKCDAIILLGIQPSGRVEIYVLPAKGAANVKHINIPAKTSGKSHWKQYRQHVGNVSLNEIEGANRELLDSGNTLHHSVSYWRDVFASDKAGA